MRSKRERGECTKQAPPTGLKREPSEHPCWDPKDGELCLSRMKPEETLVEVRSGSDVQIDRQTWA
jgi:hypothetical protein